MLTAIMVLIVFSTLFNMATVGHMSNIEKLLKAMVEAKLAELKMWHGNE